MALLDPKYVANIKLTDLANADDTTVRNATVLRPGLCPKLDGDVSHFLRGDGRWMTTTGGIVTIKSIAAITTASGVPPILAGSAAPSQSVGTQYTPLQLAHAVAAAGNKLVIEVDLAVGVTGGTSLPVAVALFDSTINTAIAATNKSVLNGQLEHIHLSTVYAPSTTSNRTYIVRFGPTQWGTLQPSGTVYINMTAALSNLWGDAAVSTMKITEYIP